MDDAELPHEWVGPYGDPCWVCGEPSGPGCRGPEHPVHGRNVALFSYIRELHNRTTQQLEMIMATVEDLKAKADALNQALADMDARIAATGDAAQPAIDAAAAALDTALTHVQGEDAAAAAPVASTQPSPGVASTSAPAEAVAVLTLYTFDGTPGSADATMWPLANVKTSDGRDLYRYSMDSPGTPPQGDNLGGVWHLYTGPTEPVAVAPAVEDQHGTQG